MATKSSRARFVVYLGPADREAELEPMKIYRLARSMRNDPADHLRVVDDSGEDYLYPAELFEPIDVPSKVRTAMSGHR